MAEEPNFTVYIIYKKKQLQFKFNITRLTSDNLKTKLKILLKEYLLSQSHSNVEAEISQIIGFQSYNKNIQISYILSLFN